MKNDIFLKLYERRLEENMAAGLGTMSNPYYVSGNLVHNSNITDKINRYKKRKEIFLKMISHVPVL